MLIAIDHGNKQMKTAHHTFSSGLCESDTKPPFGENVLHYKGKYYTLSDQAQAVEINKNYTRLDREDLILEPKNTEKQPKGQPAYSCMRVSQGLCQPAG